jgi:1-acyl-sn-glycerol-3-phosphate acyltransferase
MHRSPFVLILASLRLTRVGIHIFGALALASVYPALSPLTQRHLLRWWSRGLLRVLNVHHVTNGSQVLVNDAACLFVANHISWLDIFAVNVTTPARFVAKSEVSQWPVLGWLVQRSGTLFVRRGVRSDAVRVNALVTGLLQQGRAIALFPQGTSTTPEQPVHFHAPLLQSAIAANSQVQPVAIFYHDGQGVRHDAAAFVGDTTFMQSLWRIVCTTDIRVTVTYLPQMDATGQDRRSLAMQAQDAVNMTLARHIQAWPAGF